MQAIAKEWGLEEYVIIEFSRERFSTMGPTSYHAQASLVSGKTLEDACHHLSQLDDYTYGSRDGSCWALQGDIGVVLEDSRDGSIDIEITRKF